MVNVKKGNEYTMTELKEFLRARGLSTCGGKSELIARLEEVSSDIWSELIRGNDYVSEQIPEVANETAEIAASSSNANYELEMIRRERDLLRRELELVRRENEIANRVSTSARSSPASESSVAGIGSIKSMLSEFDGTGNGFWKWKQQIELLRMTYNLDENATKLLISTKLQGKAMSWFHSKAEHITLSSTDLLQRMKQMFDHRPSKLTLRKEFESRTWQSNELFSEYYHDKVILANQVPIEEDEIIDYVIDGVPDQRLRDQARLQCFDETSKLLKAFEKISLKSGPKHLPDKEYRFKKETESAKESHTNVYTYRGKLRCFNCHERGHRSTECTKPRPKIACLKCGDMDHRSSNCPQEKPKTDNSTNLIQPLDVSDPYMIPVRYEISDNEGNTCNYTVKAMVDTGSPISLIKTSYVPDSYRAPLKDDFKFFGVNGSPLKLLGMFEKDVKINNIEMRINFFVVPNDTMTCVALLGRDFTSCPAVKITVGETLQVLENTPNPAIDESVSFVNQIMHIDYRGEPLKKSEALNVDARINRNVADKVREMYENVYMTPVASEQLPPEPEMIINLKHEQPISSRARRLAYADKEKLRDIPRQLSEEGIRPSEKNVESVINYPVPRNTKAASENIVKSQNVNEKSYNRTHKNATTYNVGDYVVIRNIDTTAGVNKKLIPKYKGPYVVRKVLNTDRYVISDVDGFQITQLPYNGIVAPDHMKHWVRDS